MTPRAKEKARKVKTKVKVKVIKVKVAKLPMLSLILGLKSNNQQLPSGDQPEPELTALFTLEDAMPPKSEAQEESPRRGRSPRRATLQAPFKEHCDQERYGYGSKRFGISFWVQQGAFQ